MMTRLTEGRGGAGVKSHQRIIFVHRLVVVEYTYIGEICTCVRRH